MPPAHRYTTTQMGDITSVVEVRHPRPGTWWLVETGKVAFQPILIDVRELRYRQLYER